MELEQCFNKVWRLKVVHLNDGHKYGIPYWRFDSAKEAKAINKQAALEWCKKEIWEKMRLSELPEPLRLPLFDWAFAENSTFEPIYYGLILPYKSATEQRPLRFSGFEGQTELTDDVVKFATNLTPESVAQARILCYKNYRDPSAREKCQTVENRIKSLQK